MKKEVLFRVWDGSKMEHNVIAGIFGVFYVNPMRKKDGLDENDTACLTPYNTKYPNGTNVMQFTGIMDKNEKAIFEGDIVKHRFRRIWQTQEHISTVVWNQEFCCYYLFDGVSNHRMRDDMVYEVIGNMFDNPELLK